MHKQQQYTHNNEKYIRRPYAQSLTTVKYLAHTDPIFAEPKILPFSKLITFAQIKLVHSIVHKYSPTSLITFFGRMKA
jgi:hypothetical protein